MRKKISNAQLQTELVEILKNLFIPSKKMIKEQVEWLIEHRYMKRDDKDINTFIYLAWNIHALPVFDNYATSVPCKKKIPASFHFVFDCLRNLPGERSVRAVDCVNISKLLIGEKKANCGICHDTVYFIRIRKFWHPDLNLFIDTAGKAATILYSR